LTLTTGFKSMFFAKDSITTLSEYAGFCWVFARGIRIEHGEENRPRFFVFWAFDLTGIRRELAENGFILRETAEA
jgi:hypothetical protein